MSSLHSIGRNSSPPHVAAPVNADRREAAAPRPVSTTPLKRLERLSEKMSSTLGGDGRAATRAVETIRHNQDKARNLGVDSTRRVFWSRALGVGVAALAVAAAVTAAVATGGAALIAAAAIASVVCAVSVLDAKCAHMNRENAQAIAQGRPPPHELPLGDSALGNGLYQIGMGIYGLHLRRTGQTMSPGGQRRVLRMAQVADKLLRGGMMVAAASCTAGVSAAFDSTVRIAPLVGNSVSLLHAIARLRLDRRSSRDFDAQVNSIHERFDGMKQTIERERRLYTDDPEKPGKIFDPARTAHLDDLLSTLLDARSEAVAEAERMKRMVPHARVDAFGAVAAGIALGSILLAGFAPGFHAGVEQASQVSGLPLQAFPLASPTLQAPFLASRIGGARLEGGMPDAIHEAIEHARKAENGFAQFAYSELLVRAGQLLETQNERLRDLHTKDATTDNAKRRLVLRTFSTMAERGDVRAKHVAQIIAGLPFAEFDAAAKYYEAGTQLERAIIDDAHALRNEVQRSRTGMSGDVLDHAQVAAEKSKVKGIELSPMDLDASLVLQAAYARALVPQAGGAVAQAASRFLESVGSWRAQMSETDLEVKRGQAVDLFGKLLDAMPEAAMVPPKDKVEDAGDDSSEGDAFAALGSYLNDILAEFTRATAEERPGYERGFEQLMGRFEKVATATQRVKDADARAALSSRLRRQLADLTLENDDQRMQLGNVLARLGMPDAYASVGMAHMTGAARTGVSQRRS